MPDESAHGPAQIARHVKWEALREALMRHPVMREEAKRLGLSPSQAKIIKAGGVKSSGKEMKSYVGVNGDILDVAYTILMGPAAEVEMPAFEGLFGFSAINYAAQGDQSLRRGYPGMYLSIGASSLAAGRYYVALLEISEDKASLVASKLTFDQLDPGEVPSLLDRGRFYVTPKWIYAALDAKPAPGASPEQAGQRSEVYFFMFATPSFMKSALFGMYLAPGVDASGHGSGPAACHAVWLPLFPALGQPHVSLSDAASYMEIRSSLDALSRLEPFLKSRWLEREQLDELFETLEECVAEKKLCAAARDLKAALGYLVQDRRDSSDPALRI